MHWHRGRKRFGKKLGRAGSQGLLSSDGFRVGGKAELDCTDLLALPPRGLRARQGRDIAMIFQDPSSRLNPVQTVGVQIFENLRAHCQVGRAEARTQAIDALTRVGMPDPSGMMRRYPHQFSGRQRQCVMIAMAITLQPGFWWWMSRPPRWT